MRLDEIPWVPRNTTHFYEISEVLLRKADGTLWFLERASDASVVLMNGGDNEPHAYQYCPTNKSIMRSDDGLYVRAVHGTTDVAFLIADAELTDIYHGRYYFPICYSQE